MSEPERKEHKVESGVVDLPKEGRADLSRGTDTGSCIADVLIKEGFLSQEQYAYARRVASKLTAQRSLTSILIELGQVTPEQIRKALRKNMVSIRIGDFLVELGYLKQADLAAALGIQKESGGRRKLGEVLVENRFIDELRFAETLAFQLGIPFVEVDAAKIDRKILAKVPIMWLADHDLIPIGEDKGQLVVAFADPMDKRDRSAAESLFGNTFKTAIGTSRSIREAIAILKKSMSRTDAEIADEKTVTGIVNTILEAALAEGVSDIHMEPMRDRLRVRFRRDGVLVLHKDFSKELSAPLASRVKILCEANIAEKRRHQDGRLIFESIRTGISVDVRVSIYVTIYGEKLVMRLLTQKAELLDINEIGMPPRLVDRFIYEALDTPSGVLIITGPTGSGKTTSLYACINSLNNLNTSIITAEDPVEYLVEGIAQCSMNPKIGLTYEETLRHIVRQDPDIIVLGEIRDNFSAETAIQAALTGHKVLTTFHTEDSIGGLLRLMNMDIETFLISSTVVCVLAQRLLRKVCTQCATPYLVTPIDLRRLGSTREDLRGAEFMVGTGCSHCRYTGYRGRTGIFEMLVLNEYVKDAIINKKTSYEIRRISVETSGLVTLMEAGLAKASRGIISLEDTLRILPRLGKPRPLHEIRRMLGE